MPAILERLVSQLKAKGYDDSSARAIAMSSLQKAGDLDSHGNATTKGAYRGRMSPAARAKDRAAKRSGHSPLDYNYNSKTNRATLRIRKTSRGR